MWSRRTLKKSADDQDYTHQIKTKFRMIQRSDVTQQKKNYFSFILAETLLQAEAEANMKYSEKSSFLFKLCVKIRIRME